MSTVKVTVTLGEEELAQVRALVEKGQVANVSAFVQHAVRQSLDDAAGWGTELAEALAATGGPMTPEEIVWADTLLAGDYPPDAVPQWPESPFRTILPPGTPELESPPEIEALPEGGE